MDLMEYQARQLFELAGLPVKKGVVADSVKGLMDAVEQNREITFPLVCKAQVPIGGRGKAGGIKITENMEELEKAASQILGMEIKGHVVRRLLAVEKAEIEKEWYLSIMLDRLTKCPLIIFSSKGGMDIEEVSKRTPEAICKITVNPLEGITEGITERMLNAAEITEGSDGQFVQILNRLYDFFLSRDCLLAEINPLVIDKIGDIVALDSKVSIDDSALYRHPETAEFKLLLEKDGNPLIKEACDKSFLYIPCDDKGTIAVTSNGSGMLMSCMDRIHDNGMDVYAGLDLGGGATSERIKEAVRIISSGDHVKAVFINIFGGITRCDEVASGIRRAKEIYEIDKPIIVRFEGTNKDKGMEIISGLDSVFYVDGLIQGVDELVKRKDQLI